MSSSKYGIGVPSWDGNAKKYIEEKLAVLKEFDITPTASEMVMLYTKTTEIAIDNAVRSIMEHHWG